MPSNYPAVKRTKVRRRDLLRRYKQKVGCRCGERRAECLDFHDREPGTHNPKLNKTLSTGRFSRGGSMWANLSYAEIVEEIKKCDVVCANCHRVITAKDMGWRGLGAEQINFSPNLRAAEEALGLI